VAANSFHNHEIRPCSRRDIYTHGSDAYVHATAQLKAFELNSSEHIQITAYYYLLLMPNVSDHAMRNHYIALEL
jgi:hypothetical protein